MKTIGANILVRVNEDNGFSGNMSDGGVLIPNQQLREAKVLEVGTGHRQQDMHVKVGDTVGIDMSAAVPVTWDGERKGRYIIEHKEVIYKYDN